MTEMATTAELFFDACETGQGWEKCQSYCHSDATFASQAAALTGIDTVEAYAGWMSGLFGPIPAGKAEVMTFAVDEARNKVVVFGVFHGTHTADGGPVPPTGKTMASDYAYDLVFEDGKIRHVTKIWNDAAAMQQLGWT
jgi:predicted ester cyclase